ncbi:MAG: hypothetical protein MJZ56_00985, partial [Bacteroidales bacterium]|nr:hypothetical protein [Bacteroidales bacterium]
LFISRKNTKFQSNSQRGADCLICSPCCLSAAKIQNFKAIHNRCGSDSLTTDVVYQPQKYKISKQFTTKILCTKVFEILLSGKKQNLIVS